MPDPTMRAAVYLGPQQLEIRHAPIPRPGKDEILVNVKAATTCGTDVKTYRRGHPKFPPPFVFGHEFGGDIVEVGAGIKNFRPGMRVTANVFAECGACFYCRHDQGNLCENLVYNFGAFAEYLIIPSSIACLNTFEIPDHISYAQAAVLEPLVSVVHAHRLLQIQPGERVAIIGAGGPNGLLHLQMALHKGASRVIAVDVSDVRLEIARHLGASAIVNANKEDTLMAVRDFSDGRGADVVIESAGTKLTWETAVDCVRRGGRILWFGGLPTGAKVELDATRIHYGEIAMFGIHGGTALDAYCAFELITSQTINTQALLTGEAPLEDLEAALKQMIAGEVVKMVIKP
jgi:L-iditol 2-dehydrogenase